MAVVEKAVRCPAARRLLQARAGVARNRGKAAEIAAKERQSY